MGISVGVGLASRRIRATPPIKRAQRPIAGAIQARRGSSRRLARIWSVGAVRQVRTLGRENRFKLEEIGNPVDWLLDAGAYLAIGIVEPVLNPQLKLLDLAAGDPSHAKFAGPR